MGTRSEQLGPKLTDQNSGTTGQDGERSEKRNKHSIAKDQLPTFSAQRPVIIHKVRRVEKYDDGRDATIRFLRDSFENTWEDVAILYNLHWSPSNDGTTAAALRRQYNITVPKEARAPKRVGKIIRGIESQAVFNPNMNFPWVR